MAVKVIPWSMLDPVYKAKFKDEAEYMNFFVNTILPDTDSKKKYIASTKEKVAEGLNWAKEFAKFHAQYTNGFPYVFKKDNAMHIVGGKEFLLDPQYVAYHHVRKVMRDKLLEKKREENPKHLITQAESNYITGRTKVAYMVYAGKLKVKDNLLYQIREDMTEVPTPMTLQKSIKFFDEYYILDSVLIYPRHWHSLTENLINDVMTVR